MSTKDYNVILDVDDPNIGLGLEHNEAVSPSSPQNAASMGIPSGRIGSVANPSSVGLTEARPSDALGSSSFFSLAYYRRYFSITTSDVLERLKLSLSPTARFRSTIEGNPDLYGPFWTSVTIGLVLFMTTGAGHLESLSGSLLGIFGYAWVMPLVVWAVATWAGIRGVGMVDVISVYGYGMAVWLLVALVCLAPVEAVRWVSVLAGISLSGVFILRNMHALLGPSEDNPGTGFDLDAGTSFSTEKAGVLRALWVAVGVCHCMFGVFLKIWFFNYEWSLL